MAVAAAAPAWALHMVNQLAALMAQVGTTTAQNWNATATLNQHLFGLSRLQAGVVPAGFPETRGNLSHLQAPQVALLLAAYGLPAAGGGNPQTRLDQERGTLANHVGLRL